MRPAWNAKAVMTQRLSSTRTSWVMCAPQWICWPARVGSPGPRRIAEGRALPAEHVVRLWWLAGNRDRAVQVARVRAAFAAAVDRLPVW